MILSLSSPSHYWLLLSGKGAQILLPKETTLTSHHPMEQQGAPPLQGLCRPWRALAPHGDGHSRISSYPCRPSALHPGLFCALSPYWPRSRHLLWPGEQGSDRPLWGSWLPSRGNFDFPQVEINQCGISRFFKDAFIQVEKGQDGILIKSTLLSPGLRRQVAAALTLNKGQLIPITVDWVLSGSTTSVWGKVFLAGIPLVEARRAGSAKWPLSHGASGGKCCLLPSMLSRTGLQPLPGGHCPTQPTPNGTADRERELRHWGLLWALNWLWGKWRVRYSGPYFFIHVTSGLKENITESFLLKTLYDAMNEDKWCQHKRRSLVTKYLTLCSF